MIIRPRRRISLDLPELWRYRELFYFLVWRDLKVRYKQTVIGAGWALIQPVMTMIVFSVIFGGFAKIPSDGLPYPIFVFSGLLAWNYFSQSLNLSGQSVMANSALITKVYAPRLLLPMAAAAVPLVDFGVAFLVLIGLLAWYGIVPGVAVVALPVLLLLALVASVGVGLVVAAGSVRYRDLRYALPFVVQIWMYASPVIYPVSLVPERYRWLLSLNPMTSVIDGFRWALLGTHPPSLAMFATSALVGGILAAVGIAYFRRVESRFADVI